MSGIRRILPFSSKEIFVYFAPISIPMIVKSKPFEKINEKKVKKNKIIGYQLK